MIEAPLRYADDATAYLLYERERAAGGEGNTSHSRQELPGHAKQLGRQSLVQIERRLEAALEPGREKVLQRQREPDHGMGM